MGGAGAGEAMKTGNSWRKGKAGGRAGLWGHPIGLPAAAAASGGKLRKLLHVGWRCEEITQGGALSREVGPAGPFGSIQRAVKQNVLNIISAAVTMQACALGARWRATSPQTIRRYNII